MSVPDFQSFLVPVLEAVQDGQVKRLAEIRAQVIDSLQFSDADLNEMLPSGTQRTVDNRINWAAIYLQRAGMLHRPARGRYGITDRGKETLATGPTRLTVKDLNQYPEFREFHTGAKTEEKRPPTGDQTPEEALESAYEELRSDLATEILNQVKECSPAFFERLVVELLVSMGYGGSRRDAGMAVGKSGDEGIDGIIKEDRLGLDLIYIQAKRWTGSVGRPEIQKFVGALHGKQAKKGVFITTSTFSSDATAYVQNLDPKVALIDGKRLAELMIDFDLGVSTHSTYTLKKIDSDYFTEE